jgi:hypothetical protein
MSVNQCFGINESKVKRFGKYFATIDFEHGNNKMGWLNIFFSAWNAAAIADKLF